MYVCAREGYGYLLPIVIIGVVVAKSIGYDRLMDVVLVDFFVLFHVCDLFWYYSRRIVLIKMIHALSA